MEEIADNSDLLSEKIVNLNSEIANRFQTFNLLKKDSRKK